MPSCHLGSFVCRVLVQGPRRAGVGFLECSMPCAPLADALCWVWGAQEECGAVLSELVLRLKWCLPVFW